MFYWYQIKRTRRPIQVDHLLVLCLIRNHPDMTRRCVIHLEIAPGFTAHGVGITRRIRKHSLYQNAFRLSVIWYNGALTVSGKPPQTLIEPLRQWSCFRTQTSMALLLGVGRHQTQWTHLQPSKFSRLKWNSSLKTTVPHCCRFQP